MSSRKKIRFRTSRARVTCVHVEGAARSAVEEKFWLAKNGNADGRQEVCYTGVYWLMSWDLKGFVKRIMSNG